MSSGHCRAAAVKSEGPGPGRFELADVVRRFGDDLSRSVHLEPQQSKALWSIKHCRTERLGGHKQKCDECGYESRLYNSCLNRHCPKCQFARRARWLQARIAELLAVAYFHTVFTQPHHLNGVTQWNQRLMYNLLFSCSAATLLEFAASGRHGMKGRLGITSLLHTWNQLMGHHPHVHCIVPGGVISADRQSWTHSRGEYLFCTEALGQVFRGKYLEGLKGLYDNGELKLYGKLTDPKQFRKLIDRLYSVNWNVYCKSSFAGPERALAYLSNYTHRVAISNYRILDVDGQGVTFSWLDRNNGNRRRTKKLDGVKFLERFVQHVLPKGYMRIRYFGFLGGSKRKENLETCRRLLGMKGPLALPVPEPEPEDEPAPAPEIEEGPGSDPEPPTDSGPEPVLPTEPAAGREQKRKPKQGQARTKSVAELFLEITGRPIDLCPRCRKGKMVRVAVLPPATGPPRQRKSAS